MLFTFAPIISFVSQKIARNKRNNKKAIRDLPWCHAWVVGEEVDPFRYLSLSSHGTRYNCVPNKQRVNETRNTRTRKEKENEGKYPFRQVAWK